MNFEAAALNHLIDKSHTFFYCLPTIRTCPAVFFLFSLMVITDRLEGDGEVDIGTVLELLPGKCEDLEKGFFQFSDHWADACFYMKLSNTEDNPMVTDWGGVYVTESFEKYLFRKAFHMYQRRYPFRVKTGYAVA